MFSFDTLTIDGEPVAVINFKDGNMITFMRLVNCLGHIKRRLKQTWDRLYTRLEFIMKTTTYPEFISHFSYPDASRTA